MEWKLTTAQKIRTAASLVIVFLLILATNLIDSNHFDIVRKSLTTVYEDRLVAKNYIYKISRQMQIKQDILRDDSLRGEVEINEMANDSIRVLLEMYSGTKLTEEETRRYLSLSDNVTRLFRYEENYSEGEVINAELPSMSSSEPYYARIFEELDALSEIQIQEGRRQIIYSNETIDSSDLISKIEIGVLIFIGLLLQLLIFIKPMK